MVAGILNSGRAMGRALTSCIQLSVYRALKNTSHCSSCWQQDRQKSLLMRVTEMSRCHATGTDTANQTGENPGALVLSLTQVPLIQGLPGCPQGVLPPFPFWKRQAKLPWDDSQFIHSTNMCLLSSSDDNLFVKPMEGIGIGHISNSAD